MKASIFNIDEVRGDLSPVTAERRDYSKEYAVVFVIDKRKQSLSPTTNARARMLLKQGKAVVHRVYPFVIRLKNMCEATGTYTIKLDPGAKTTGVAIVDKTKALFFMELIHRGEMIKRNLGKRRGVRRSRRNRKTRYRAPRFLNRTRPEGWLAPSVKSRADNVVNLVKKILQWVPLDKAVIERVSFNTSEITEGQKLYGAQYQQGPLYKTKLRRFIFEKFNNTCCYCNGASGNSNLEVEHVTSKAAGGTNSTRNMILSCRTCNEKKGKMSLSQFGKIMSKDYSYLEPKSTPKSAAIIQSARNYTIREIAKLDLEIETGEGWETALNRTERDLPKEHYYDAMCVGGQCDYTIATSEVFTIKAQGRGLRLMTRVDRFGFPRQQAKGFKVVKGFQTGDLVKAVVPSGKKAGAHIGRVAIRENGYFNITTDAGIIQGISAKYCKTIQKGDGYDYSFKKTA